MRLFYVIFFLFLALPLKAQNIKVISKNTNDPVYGVAIYNKDKSKTAVTNFLGEANLDAFTNSEKIYFKHLSHLLKVISKEQLQNTNKVYLKSNTEGLDQIVISASKFKQNKKDVTQKIISLKDTEIQLANLRSLCVTPHLSSVFSG